MINRLYNRSKFLLERLLLRGSQYQLLIIAFLIGFISLTAGILAYTLTGKFESLGKSTWWAFLRMSDPGYLGDDEGVLLRTVSTAVTVLGYVVFMGALIAIMTQWLHKTMRTLENGLTSISQHDHILILGWTNRTSQIVKEILVSEGRVRRFLKRIGTNTLNIVLLSEDQSSELAQELRVELGDLWKQNRITLRSGNPLRIEHLKRVDFMNAAVIILAGSDFVSEGSEAVDAKAIKILMSISNHSIQEGIADPPLIVAEIFDSRKITVAKSSYSGKNEIVAGDSVISRLITQNVRHQGLSYIYSELLTHTEGNEIYIRNFPQLEGENFRNVVTAFYESIPLGLLRLEGKNLVPMLNPPHDLEIRKDDRVVILARSFKAAELSDNLVKNDIKLKHFKNPEHECLQRRLLILGWNHKIPTLMREFNSYKNEIFNIDILSLMPLDQREEYMSRYDLNLENVCLQNLQGDYTSPSDLKQINLGEYDNILFIANDWLDSNEESDARAILGSLVLRELLSKGDMHPEIIMELMDPENEKLFLKRTGEVIISPLIVSHILAHVALRRELNTVFEELFTVGGAEIYFRNPGIYSIKDNKMSFRQLQNKIAQYGEICLGVRLDGNEQEKNGGIILNPSPDSVWNIEKLYKFVVLTTYS